VKFYYPNGKEIKSFDKFIKFYNRCYYIENSYIVEAYFDELIEKGIKEKSDIFKILAWKTGKINQKESKVDNFVYYKGWEDDKSFSVKHYGREINLKILIDYAFENQNELKKMKPQDIIGKFNNENVIPEGIGTVYLVTLCYFITQAKYPIFDRFADIALKAVKKGMAPLNKIKASQLPDKSIKGFNEKMKVYDDFCELIQNVEEEFNVIYKNSRDIDRALWVYGHLF